MGEVFGFIWCAITGLFRSRAALQAEILVLRHQLNILRRRSPKRVAPGKSIAWYFGGLSLVCHSAGCAKDPPARDRYPLASRWFPSLALEITTARGRAEYPRGHSPPHSRDERCQPLVGSAADSRRTAQAWDRCRPDHGRKYMARRRRPPSPSRTKRSIGGRMLTGTHLHFFGELARPYVL
jgi:hypothetical protein